MVFKWLSINHSNILREFASKCFHRTFHIPGKIQDMKIFSIHTNYTIGNRDKQLRHKNIGIVEKATLINPSCKFVYVSSRRRKVKGTHNIKDDQAYPISLDTLYQENPVVHFLVEALMPETDLLRTFVFTRNKVLQQLINLETHFFLAFFFYLWT